MSPENHKALIHIRRILLVLGGGGVAAVGLWVFAFQLDGIPMTNNGVSGLMLGPMPLAVCLGSALGAVFAYLLEKRGEK